MWTNEEAGAGLSGAARAKRTGKVHGWEARREATTRPVGAPPPASRQSQPGRRPGPASGLGAA